MFAFLFDVVLVCQNLTNLILSPKYGYLKIKIALILQMSEIRINIITSSQTISGNIHGSFGDVLVASLTFEPETIKELETAIQRFIPQESDWSFFRFFRKYENFEPYDAELLVIDLSAKVIMADSTYSYYSKEGTIRIKTNDNENFGLPYKLSDDWKYVRSMPEFEGISSNRREWFRHNLPFDARQVLFGKPLCEFIVTEYLANKDRAEEDLFTEIHAKWLMIDRADLRGKTPREILLEKHNFINFDLHSRSLQWSFTKIQPPPLSKDSNAYKFAGFGTHEIVVYYDLVRYLLGECFDKNITEAQRLEQFAESWLNHPQIEFSGRTPAHIIESERRRINLTMSAHECLIDEDCEMCEMLAAEFETPMFWGLDGSNMEDDRFEFSFEKNRQDWEAEQLKMEEFNREFDKKYSQNDDDFFDQNEQLV